MAAPRALLPQQAFRHASHALRLQRQRPLQPLARIPAAPRRMLVVSAGLQPPLSSGERKAKRAEAARLGKALVSVTLGQKGLSPAFLEGLATALAANELVKVRVGSDYDLKEAAAELERECDCVVVHKIGFVLTLYRDSKLAPPPCLRGDAAEEEGAEEGEGGGGGKGGKKKRDKGPQLPPPPPEFTIMS